MLYNGDLVHFLTVTTIPDVFEPASIRQAATLIPGGVRLGFSMLRWNLQAAARREHGATLSKSLTVALKTSKGTLQRIWFLNAALTYRLYLQIPEFWAGYQCSFLAA